MQFQYILLVFFLTLWSAFSYAAIQLGNALVTINPPSTQLSSIAGTQVSTQNNHLSQQRWHSRVVIFKTTQAEINAKAALLSQNSAALIDRKLLVFAVSDNKTLVFNQHGDKQGEFSETTLVSLQEATSRLRNQNCTLIGLDGGTKQVYEDLALTQIFADIDGMPMRRAERLGE